MSDAALRNDIAPNSLDSLVYVAKQTSNRRAQPAGIIGIEDQHFALDSNDDARPFQQCV